jgi:hypothetical protein
MPNPLNNIAVPDQYTDACTISYVWGARGGSFLVANASVYVQLQYGKHGEESWTDEYAITPTTGAIEPGTIGIRFRNYVAGTVARVGASITPPQQPGVQIGSSFDSTLSSTGGLTPPAGGAVITGLVGSTGTIIAGAGFAVVHTGTGTYDITYTTAFATTPVVVATGQAAGTNQRNAMITAQSATGFSIIILQGNASPQDSAFNFLAQAVV